MSAPNTDPEKEEKKHKPALLGIRATLVYAVILLGAFVVWNFVQSDGPEGSDVQIDGRTGDAVQTE